MAGSAETRASARTIALPPFLTELLREHLARHQYEFVFTTPSGTWLWRSTFLRRVFRPAVDGSEASGTKAGCAAVRPGLTFHGLRHSHKTWLISGGAPEIAQARRLGHHLDNRVIETYSHVAPEVEQRLLEDLERRWHAVAPLPPTPSPRVGDSGRMAAAVPLFATMGVTHRPSRPAGPRPRDRSRSDRRSRWGRGTARWLPRSGACGHPACPRPTSRCGGCRACRLSG